MLYDDKRDFFRMMVNAESQIQLLDSEAGHSIDGVCKDLSATGLSINVEEPLEIHTLVKVKVESGNQSVLAFDAVARVTRCTFLDSDEKEISNEEYNVGLEIVELN